VDWIKLAQATVYLQDFVNSIATSGVTVSFSRRILHHIVVLLFRHSICWFASLQFDTPEPTLDCAYIRILFPIISSITEQASSVLPRMNLTRPRKCLTPN
jgi:hypothetical protein